MARLPNSMLAGLGLGKFAEWDDGLYYTASGQIAVLQPGQTYTQMQTGGSVAPPTVIGVQQTAAQIAEQAALAQRLALEQAQALAIQAAADAKARAIAAAQAAATTTLSSGVNQQTTGATISATDIAIARLRQSVEQMAKNQDLLVANMAVLEKAVIANKKSQESLQAAVAGFSSNVGETFLAVRKLLNNYGKNIAILAGRVGLKNANVSLTPEQEDAAVEAAARRNSTNTGVPVSVNGFGRHSRSHVQDAEFEDDDSGSDGENNVM